jgi:hypothetical protein
MSTTRQHHLKPTKVPDEELARDARTIRAILRKYSLDPSQYTAVLPLHPATLPGINRTRCITIADILATMYERDYIYEVYDREPVNEGLSY